MYNVHRLPQNQTLTNLAPLLIAPKTDKAWKIEKAADERACYGLMGSDWFGPIRPHPLINKDYFLKPTHCVFLGF